MSSPTLAEQPSLLARIYGWFWGRKEQESKATDDDANGDMTATTFTVTRRAPAVSTMIPVLSWWGHIRFMFWPDPMIRKGYEQHNGMFRMPFFGQWPTTISKQYLNEIIHVPDSSLSFMETLNWAFQLDYTFPALAHDPIHLSLIKTLNKNLDSIYPEIADEVKYVIPKSLEDKPDKDGWSSIKAYKTFNECLGHINQRGFIGLPLCRDDKWIKALHSAFTNIALRAWVLTLLPESWRKNINYYAGRYGPGQKKATDLLTPVIEERLSIPEDQRPYDMLSWAISRSAGDRPSVDTIIGILLILDSAAQHLTTQAFVHALYNLATYQEYLPELRQEVEEVMGEDYDLWTNAALERLHKLDSFVKETIRLSLTPSVNMSRMVMQDFTFSNGVTVPRGEMIAALGLMHHQDPSVYPDPEEFKPFRFYDMTRAEGLPDDSKKYQTVGISYEYLSFGLGKHACPGRWYAAMVMKHVLAFLITHYDFKLPSSAKGKRPADLNIFGVAIPNSSAKILFKKRETE